MPFLLLLLYAHLHLTYTHLHYIISLVSSYLRPTNASTTSSYCWPHTIPPSPSSTSHTHKFLTQSYDIRCQSLKVSPSQMMISSLDSTGLYPWSFVGASSMLNCELSPLSQRDSLDLLFHDFSINSLLWKMFLKYTHEIDSIVEVYTWNRFSF